MSYLDKRLNERQNDPEFKKAWKENELEYQIARNVIRKRKERGLTQAQLAKLIQTKQSAISRLENGYSNVTIGTLEKVAEALETDVYRLMGAKRDSAQEESSTAP